MSIFWVRKRRGCSRKVEQLRGVGGCREETSVGAESPRPTGLEGSVVSTRVVEGQGHKAQLPGVTLGATNSNASRSKADRRNS